MSDVRNLVERLFRGDFTRAPSTIVMFANTQDPARRPRFSQVFSLLPTPEEPRPSGDATPASTPEQGADHPAGTKP